MLEVLKQYDDKYMDYILLSEAWVAAEYQHPHRALAHTYQVQVQVSPIPTP